MRAGFFCRMISPKCPGPKPGNTLFWIVVLLLLTYSFLTLTYLLHAWWSVSP